VEPLSPVRYPNRDFFVCNIFDALPYFKDDMASMEHPVFSLSTKPDQRVLHYEHNGNTLTILPGFHGLATIFDKDVLVYCASYLKAALNEGYEIQQKIRVTAYDILVSTNRGIDGRSYERLKMALTRLSGTRIKTNIQTNNMRIIQDFGLIDAWGIVEKSPVDGRMIAIEIKPSEWFLNAILANELLTINRNYFRLRKPIERRMYELARKHCGDSEVFRIGLPKLHLKIGTTAPLFKFRAAFREIIKTNHLPDYRGSMDRDIVTFTSRRMPANDTNVRLPRLMPETFEKARRAAPGWDVYHLESQWREWIADKEKPKNPDAAFIAFCRKKSQREGRP
jgi:plasmid replication initiation protein